MSISTDLDVLARLERHLADLYDLFAERLAGAPAASALFARMAMDERTHEAMVRYQRRVIEANPAEFSGLSLDVDELYHMTMEVKRAGSLERISVHDAVREALVFEGSAAEYHWRMATHQANPGFNGFLSRLGAADEEHHARLEQFATTLSPLP